MTARQRQQPALPPPTGDLSEFPSWRLRRETALYRAHRWVHGPWWFASGTDGRFNLPSPEGTCYLASDAACALREALGPKLMGRNVAPRAVTDQLVVSRLAAPAGRQLADMKSPDAAAYLTREINTITPYGLTQAWAVALHAVGHPGIRYQPRFSTGPESAYALFGPEGEAAWPTDAKPREAEEVALRAGIRAASAPTLASVRVISPQP